MSKRVLQALMLAAFAIIGTAVAQDAPPARLPLVSPDSTDPAVAAAFSSIRARGGEPQNIHRTLAHAPKLFKAQSELALAIRASAQVPRVDRELIILRMTQLSGGDYEFTEHTRIGMSCGITADQIKALSAWSGSPLFNERQRAILAYADGMASRAGVDDATFAGMTRIFSPQDIVELTITAGFYYGTALGVRALGVRLESKDHKTDYGRC